MKNGFRLYAALRAASFHLIISTIIAIIAATLVFGIWYPYPYRNLAGGRDLFFLIFTIDIVCGPLLTMVIFNPIKSRGELLRDLIFIIAIQIAALAYGLHIVWQARPVYLVLEVDRFKVVAAPELDASAIALLPEKLQPGPTKGPIVVAIREPKNSEERERVLFESVQGGRDYAERPEFYIPYEDEAALKSLQRSKALPTFLKRHPNQQSNAWDLAAKKRLKVSQLKYLPVQGRHDWIAVLDKNGNIQGFLEGDGF